MRCRTAASTRWTPTARWAGRPTSATSWSPPPCCEQLGIGRVRLLTNNPDKLAALAACGIEVAGRERLQVAPNGVNDHYLATKARRFGHLL